MVVRIRIYNAVIDHCEERDFALHWNKCKGFIPDLKLINTVTVMCAKQHYTMALRLIWPQQIIYTFTYRISSNLKMLRWGGNCEWALFLKNLTDQNKQEQNAKTFVHDDLYFTSNIIIHYFNNVVWVSATKYCDRWWCRLTGQVKNKTYRKVCPY